MQNVICLHVTTALLLCPRQSFRLYALGLEGQIQCVYDRAKQLPREQVLNQQYIMVILRRLGSIWNVSVHAYIRHSHDYDYYLIRR
jgi:hypothetical protein